MVQVIQLTQEHFEEKLALSKFAFQLQLTGEKEAEERAAFDPKAEWGTVDENGRLLSALTIYPLQVWIQGKALAMGGIANVASWPDARRQGGVSKLMLHALEVMKERGQSISMLAPFSFPFYRKYGYELTVQRKNYTMESIHIPMPVDVPGQVRLVQKHTKLFSGMYEKYSSLYNGTLKRDDVWWERRIWSKPGQAAIYYADNGEPEGYVIYQVTDRMFIVHEWVELTKTAGSALWGFVANHDSMIESLVMIAAMDDATPLLMPNPRYKQEIMPYFMSRIVDVTSFLTQYIMNTSDSNEIILLKVFDQHAPWNDGVFRLVLLTDGAVEVTKVSDHINDCPIVECDIGSLTALMVGNWTTELLATAGRIKGDAAAIDILKRRIPSRIAYLMDAF